MDTAEKTSITVETVVNAPVENVWRTWTDPKHITQWCAASSDWHAPYADNDVRVGGKFKTTMAARDGSMSFDFEGVYTTVEQARRIEYVMSDGRKVSVVFSAQDGQTKVTETFDAETTHPVEVQRSGWQAILDRFKQHTEAQ